jgi:ankyrin repeat protein
MKARGAALVGAVLAALAVSSAGVRADLSDALNPFGAYYNNIARAAEKNDVAQVRRLLSSGNNPNQAEGDSLQTGLQWAAINGNIQIAAILIKAGARLNDRDKLGNTALHYAAVHDQVEIAKLLLDVGAGIDEQNHDGVTPLMLAAQKGEVEMARTLLARGANANKSDFTGRDAMSWAMDSHRAALIELLKQAALKTH